MSTVPLNIVIQATDKAQKEFQQMMKGIRDLDKEAEKATKSNKNIGAVLKENWLAATAAITAAVVAVRAITGALNEAITASSEYHLAVKKLSVAVENAGESWADSKDEIIAFTDAMQSKTIYDNNATLKLLQDLLPYTNNVSKAMEGAKIAMDMASAGLFDLSTASKYVGMAMQGNVEMLGRYIGELRSSSNEQLKNMTAAEKTAYALDLLKSKYGGMAEADVTEFAGAQKQLNNALSDFLRSIGDWVTQSPEIIASYNRITAAVLALAEANQALRSEYANLEESTKSFIDSIGKAIIGAGIGNLRETLSEVVNLGADFSRNLLDPTAAGSAGQDASQVSNNVNEKEQLLQQETDFWVQKADIITTGNDTINAIIQETSDWKKNADLEDKLFFVQNEQEKIDVILESARIDQDTQKKLSEYKIKLQKSEIDLMSKIREEDSKNQKIIYTDSLNMLKETLAMGAKESRSMAIALQAVRIGETVINTATAVMRAYAELPFPMNIGIAAATAAMGATQIGIIASQGFAEGTDSVPAMLTPGEMVFPRSMSDAIRSGDIVVGGRGAGVGGGGINNIEIVVNNPVMSTEEQARAIGAMIAEHVSQAIAEEEERI